MRVSKYISKSIDFFQNLSNLAIEIRIRKLKKSLPGYNSKKTSWSDEQGYIDVCQLAARNDSVFEVFKRSKDYRRILEHVTKEQGQAYLNMVKNEGSYLIKYFSRFQENDKIGSPVKYQYDVGEFSPTTLRYVKVLVDLKKFFGDLSNLDIVEIGSGY